MPGKTKREKTTRGRPTVLMCPRCNSMFYECTDGDGMRFCCQAGHEYAAEQLSPGVEENLRHAWANVVRTLAQIP